MAAGHLSQAVLHSLYTSHPICPFSINMGVLVDFRLNETSTFSPSPLVNRKRPPVSSLRDTQALKQHRATQILIKSNAFQGMKRKVELVQVSVVDWKIDIWLMSCHKKIHSVLFPWNKLSRHLQWAVCSEQRIYGHNLPKWSISS